MKKKQNSKIKKYEVENKREKYQTRKFNYCRRCGRTRGYNRIMGMCRICIRELALEGLLPGVTKSSW